jgi:hypothetical protein
MNTISAFIGSDDTFCILIFLLECVFKKPRCTSVVKSAFFSIYSVSCTLHTQHQLTRRRLGSCLFDSWYNMRYRVGFSRYLFGIRRIGWGCSFSSHSHLSWVKVTRSQDRIARFHSPYGALAFQQLGSTVLRVGRRKHWQRNSWLDKLMTIFKNDWIKSVANSSDKSVSNCGSLTRHGRRTKEEARSAKSRSAVSIFAN